MRSIFLMCSILFISAAAFAQKSKSANLVYVDDKGVMRYTRDHSEASFFGVNYTVPFAYGYRSHQALGIEVEKAIDADVYHMSLLGLDAFRVHVWDVEISDSLGNLLQNEHLRLFDYLVKKLEQYNIKILITPIAFWGNGYPEQDIHTNGFSYVYGKGPSVVKEEAFKAQENYLKQFFAHVNPYTNLTYKDDPGVIAMEINNEPHHSGPKERTTEYINRMAAAVKSTGWTKPIFYNISESPSYADAVAKATVDGHSFQWYPTGLVAGHEQKGNFLPNVDQYFIPFGDTIAAFKNRAKMVYEFDAGDVMQPIMYPAMARSFRTAGFQWATQFAYDPMYTAYANTEYQTHYLNLVYTPAKAISLLIASKAFHRLPRRKSYGSYPADTLFDVFRVSYKEQLSEMNSDEEFYYTGSTSTKPKNISKLKHIAGVGNSSVVEYGGNGAYFLEHLEDGGWRLEVFPDVIELNDPFEKASPRKAVRGIQWKKHSMKILLPDLGKDFMIQGMNEGNHLNEKAVDNEVYATPGTYLISTYAKSKLSLAYPKDGGFFDFIAPAASITEPTVVHKPVSVVTAFDATTVVRAIVAGIDSADTVSIEFRNSLNQWKTVVMRTMNGLNYIAEVPKAMHEPGVINYRIIIRKTNGDSYTFPGGYKGNPYAWDEYHNDTWEMLVAQPGSDLELFNAREDRSRIMVYNTNWRNTSVGYVTSETPGSLAMKVMNANGTNQFMGIQYYFGDKIVGRQHEFPDYKKIVLKARASQQVNVKLTLITSDADAYSATTKISAEWQEIEIPLSALKKDSFLLLPRPYPGFLPLWFKTKNDRPLDISDIEKLEISFGDLDQLSSLEIESVRLKQ
jgi:hypothetical protein